MVNFRAALVTVAMLVAAMAAEGVLRRKPLDAEPYHERVRQSRDRLPMQFGDWSGRDIPVPQAAVALLSPNVMLNRRYSNSMTGQTVDLLIVQCGDARDMAGHYPPVCYPAHGYESTEIAMRQWTLGQRLLEGTEYHFRRIEDGRVLSRVVSHVMMLPDGRCIRDMKSLRKFASDYRRRFFGASQVQIITDATVSTEERQKIVDTFLEASRDVIEALCSGGTQ